MEEFKVGDYVVYIPGDGIEQIIEIDERRYIKGKYIMKDNQPDSIMFVNPTKYRYPDLKEYIKMKIKGDLDGK